ncbi:similar to Kazachstania africana KAFR_0G01340 hypothetical protein [Maudiozyma saulgeensis]|uniref:Uncharacterized protein n=1 Tax=Maudiozyma saulgeensis TaxID=1789683 RepID=A0A1X7R1Z4_9SACH|nr:similar to Kazachstania africana KAFR_0G01340 hypothetical protein [Kazachstania saulgeensis]
MTHFNKLSALDSLFDENDNISNFKLSPSTSLLSKENVSINDNKKIYGTNGLASYVNKKKKLSFFNFDKNEKKRVKDDVIRTFSKRGTETKKKWLNLLEQTSIRKTLANGNPSSKKSINSPYRTNSTRDSFRIFFDNFKDTSTRSSLNSKSKHTKSIDENISKDNLKNWDHDDSTDHIFKDAVDYNLPVAPQLVNIRDIEHGLFHNATVQSTSGIDNTETSTDKKDQLTLKNNTINKISDKKEESCVININETESGEIEQFQDSLLRSSVISGSPLKRKMIEMDARDPYKFVFETPNKYSPNSDFADKEQIMDNLKSVWRLLSTENDERNNTFISTVDIQELSEMLINVTITKLDYHERKLNDLEKQITEKEVKQNFKFVSEDTFNELKKENSVKEATIGRLELEKQLDKNKIDQLTSNLRKLKLQEQAKNEATNHITATRNHKTKLDEAKIKELKKHLKTLSFFKDISIQFMKNLSQRSKNVLPYQTNKTFEDKLELLNYNISLDQELINDFTNDKEFEKSKTLISQFFSENTNIHISNVLLIRYGQLFRANKFLTQELAKFRNKTQLNFLPQSTAENDDTPDQKKFKTQRRIVSTLHEQNNIFGNQQIIARY